jgi:hypothetical protein
VLGSAETLISTPLRKKERGSAVAMAIRMFPSTQAGGRLLA